MIIKAVIVDDEESSREILKTMLTRYCEGVEICGQAGDVDTAVPLIKEQQPHIVFLDIEMPRGNGFNLFYHFEQLDFEIVFTTAYNKYAIKALRMSALDYLLKPIDVYELEGALNRYRSKHAKSNHLHGLQDDPRITLLQNQFQQDNNRLALPTQDAFRLVDINDIIRLQADGSYTLFVLKDKEKLVVSKNLKEYEDLLCNGHDFLRVHRSHIINKACVVKVVRSRPPIIEMEDEMDIKISASRKDIVLKELLG